MFPIDSEYVFFVESRNAKLQIEEVYRHFTLEEQLGVTTGVVASRNLSRLHRLAGDAPAENLLPQPAAMSDLLC